MSDASGPQTSTTKDAGRKRLSPGERRDLIVQAAVSLFAEAGFDASTRDIARQAQITQPLLYRYFPDKDSLIEAVYAQVFLHGWRPEWDALIADRSLPVRARFQRFYESYTAVIFAPDWMRLWHFAALRDGRINQWYRDVVEEQILKPLVRERRAELGNEAGFRVAGSDLDAPWLLHGGLMNHGFRQQIDGRDLIDGAPEIIARMLDMYLLLTEAESGAAGLLRP